MWNLRICLHIQLLIEYSKPGSVCAFGNILSNSQEGMRLFGGRPWCPAPLRPRTNHWCAPPKTCPLVPTLGLKLHSNGWKSTKKLFFVLLKWRFQYFFRTQGVLKCCRPGQSCAVQATSLTLGPVFWLPGGTNPYPALLSIFLFLNPFRLCSAPMGCFFS